MHRGRRGPKVSWQHPATVQRSVGYTLHNRGFWWNDRGELPRAVRKQMSDKTGTAQIGVVGMALDALFGRLQRAATYRE